MKRKLFILTFCLAAVLFNTQAQVTNSLNKILPADLVDSRSGIFRTVSGMDFMVRVNLIEGIKDVDACYDSDYGKLIIEILWYDINTELGKGQIEMIKMLKADEQQKADFLGKGPYKDLAGGSLVIESRSAECINSISGSTGRTEYSTNAKYFIYTGSALVKMSYSGKVKSETVTNFISNAADQIKNFDFTVYKNINASEKS